jgi:hypothetical protein
VAWIERNSLWIGLTADIIAIATFTNPNLHLAGLGALVGGLFFSLVGFFGGLFNRDSSHRWGRPVAWAVMVLGAFGILYCLPNLTTWLIFDLPRKASFKGLQLSLTCF